MKFYLTHRKVDKSMKFANGYGSITKLSGNRRKPYWVRSAAEKYVVDGKVKTKRTTIGYYATQKEAIKVLADYNENPYAIESTTFDKIWEISKKSKKVSAKRMQMLEGVFKNHLSSLADKLIKDVRTPDLQIIFDMCEKGSSTKDNMLAVLNNIYKYAVANDYIMKNYAEFVVYENDRTRIERVLFEDIEIEKLWKKQGIWHYDFMLMLLYTGCRFSEIANTKASNVDLENGILHITDDNAKNEVSLRSVPIHKKVLPLFKAHIGSDWAFENEQGKILYSNFYYTQLKEINEYLGVEHLFHDTRHTFTTRMRKLEVPLFYVNELIGHTNKNITDDTYNHPSIDDLREQMNKLYYRV